MHLGRFAVFFPGVRRIFRISRANATTQTNTNSVGKAASPTYIPFSLRLFALSSPLKSSPTYLIKHLSLVLYLYVLVMFHSG